MKLHPLLRLKCNTGGHNIEGNNMVQDRVESLIVNTTFSAQDDIPCERLYLEQK
jgi:hypothetical protein